MDTLLQHIELLSKEKGIDPQIVSDAVKDAMLVAARKHFRTNEDLVAEFDAQKKGVSVFSVFKVVEEVQDPVHEMLLSEALRHDPSATAGADIRIYRSTESLGRISAQTVRQVILQKVREAEREAVYSEYANRVGELVNCVVKRMEGQDLICDLGKTEARLPKKEQSRLENFSIGDRVRVVIKAVEKTGKNAGLIVSRAAGELVERLFEQEVPEIYDGTVLIKGCAREAGERTKIAVISRDRDVDSVGACVGMKGMRVQSIIRELRGEKIDIIEFSEDSVVFATHALSPAKITRVTVLSGLDRHMEVIVDDSQLSLAIGKKGQNVRLASKLLGWRIDIKSEEEKRQEVESAMAALTIPGAPVSVLIDHGLSESILEKLLTAGIPTVEKLTAVTQEDLDNAGITVDMVETIQAAVNSYYGQFDAQPDESGAYAEEAAAEAPPAEDLAEAPAPAEVPETASASDSATDPPPIVAAEPVEESSTPDSTPGDDAAATTNETKESGTIESAD